MEYIVAIIEAKTGLVKKNVPLLAVSCRENFGVLIVLLKTRISDPQFVSTGINEKNILFCLLKQAVIHY